MPLLIKCTFISFDYFNYIENHISEIDYIWNTNLNKDPFFNSLLLIVSSIVAKTVKNYCCFICRCLNKFLRQYVNRD